MHLKKDCTNASVYQQLFMEIRDRYRDHIPVYTDGSRDGNSVACATVLPSNTVISMRLPDSASIFTVESIKAQEEIKKYCCIPVHCRCSSVVRAFAHGVMGRRIDPSWWTH